LFRGWDAGHTAGLLPAFCCYILRTCGAPLITTYTLFDHLLVGSPALPRCAWLRICMPDGVTGAEPLPVLAACPRVLPCYLANLLLMFRGYSRSLVLPLYLFF